MHDVILDLLFGLMAVSVAGGVGQMIRLTSAIARLDQKLGDHISTTANGNINEIVRRLALVEARLEYQCRKMKAAVASLAAAKKARGK